MIEGYCRTNLDAYRHEEWPTVFVDVPRKGEYVISNKLKTLKVVGITHYAILDKNRPNEPQPRISVELNK